MFALMLFLLKSITILFGSWGGKHLMWHWNVLFNHIRIWLSLARRLLCQNLPFLILQSRYAMLCRQGLKKINIMGLS
uniref:Uncharacterized protein n=1 Tax=Arundo donax TaxID=35708 RepID=A0A0A9DIB6_ARUDO